MVAETRRDCIVDCSQLNWVLLGRRRRGESAAAAGRRHTNKCTKSTTGKMFNKPRKIVNVKNFFGGN